MIARPKATTVYAFTVLDAECWVSCNPRQKWDIYDKDDRHVTLHHRKITLRIPIKEYENNWKEVEG